MKAVWMCLLTAACTSGTTSADMSTCVMINGQCLYPPALTATRTQCGDVTDYCDSTGVLAPNLTCLTTPKMPPALPATVTLTGFVHAFSSGPDSKGVSIAVYDMAALKAAGNPGAVTPIAAIASSTLDPA